MRSILLVLFLLNTLAHVISYKKLQKEKSPNAMGVFAFIFINVTLAFLVWEEYTWTKWLTIILPFLGRVGLLATTIFKGKGIWIDSVILLLDIAIIFCSIRLFFLS